MFRFCSNLSKIYCREDTDWSKSEVLINSYTMFGGCFSLPGYSIEKAEDKTMAKPTTKGGYFTIKTSDSTISSSDENSANEQQDRLSQTEVLNPNLEAIKPDNEQKLGRYPVSSPQLTLA